MENKSDVIALSDLWLIGDQFVNDNYHAMSTMPSIAKMDKWDPPYVYDYYNISCFTSNPLSTVESTIAKIVNCLIKAIMNKKCYRLPRFIVIIPDWDLLKYINHNTYGIEVIFTRVLNWMMTMMVRAVDAKRDMLFNIKPGSVTSMEPKYVWMKMLQRMPSSNKVLMVRSKFNNVLKTLLADHTNHYVIDINPILRGQEYFTMQNTLNEEGKLLYWKELDECIRLYDKRKLTLRPRKNPYDLDAPKSDSAAQLRFKLPPPPLVAMVQCRNNNDRKKDCSKSSVPRHDDRHDDRHLARGNRDQRPNKIWFNRKFLYNY